MASTSLFIHFITRVGSAEPEALLGFSLPAAPKTSLSEQARLVSELWNSGVSAWDLRFVKTSATADIATGLLCRIVRPPQVHPGVFSDYCQGVAHYIQQLFRNFGYELNPLAEQATFMSFLSPFDFRSHAEVRRYEEELTIEDVYTVSTVYVTYPWTWAGQSRQRLFQALRQQQGNCLVSICLEPTRLSPQEQTLLSHATSGQVRKGLSQAGPHGKRALKIYENFVSQLRQPYLLRIGLAASSQQQVAQVGQALIDELDSEREPATRPVLQFPNHPYEWQALSRSLQHLEWVPWGNIRINNPQTARLRSLLDSREASMVFRLPVAQPARTKASQIKVLFASSNPVAKPQLHLATDQLRLANEERIIKEAIKLSRHRDRIELSTCPASTIHDFRRSLLENEFQIVHIAGHGTDEGLVMEDEQGRARIIPPDALADLLKRYSKTLRCVVLNACYSIAQAQLITSGIPFTIAMEGEVGDAAAREFARGFYDAIGAGKDFAFAYDEGCLTARLEAPHSLFNARLFTS
ncbi:MAG: CHAT domain-containing protein [Chloroflexota bacterium]|nr:CHAT domain-containing protein [Chloroflexota bacterium]